MVNTVTTIDRILREALRPSHLEIVDESVLHAGHAGAAAGGGHFQVILVSELFREKSVIERHRLVYQALGELMKQEIHALTLSTLTPEEWKASRRSVE